MIAFNGTFSDADLKTTLGALGENIFFVQVGAMDGRSFDPIHDLVRMLKWRGVLFEPVPDMFEKLKQNYADCQNLTFMNIAVADYEGLIEMTRIDPEILNEGVLNDTVLGISSVMLDRGVLNGQMLAPHLNAILDRYRRKIEVPCTRLPVALKKLGVEHFDLMVIDTEGADWMVARQIDLDIYKPRVVYLEYAHLSGYEKNACAMHFKNYGYRIYLDQRNAENFMAIRG